MQGRRERWWVWAGFAVLCLLAGSRWVLADALPVWGATLRSEAWACGLAAVVCAGVAAWRRKGFPAGLAIFGFAAVGAGLLAAPALGATMRGAAGESFNRTISLAFVPLVALVWSGRSAWWPGLAGLAGALLVLPFTAPEGVAGYVGLAVVPLAVGAACALSQRYARGVAAEWAAALLLGGGAVGLIMLEAVRVATSGEQAHAFSAGAVGLDTLEAALVVAVVLRADGVRYAARYFVVLLVMLMEGTVLLHAEISLRFGAGILLLAAAAGGLLRGSRTAEGTSVLHLR